MLECARGPEASADTVSDLLAAGASVTAVDKGVRWGGRAWPCAVPHGSPCVAADTQGMTALLWAYEMGAASEVKRLLVAGGVDLCAKDRVRHTRDTTHTSSVISCRLLVLLVRLLLPLLPLVLLLGPFLATLPCHPLAALFLRGLALVSAPGAAPVLP
jgi:hypothetical protein